MIIKLVFFFFFVGGKTDKISTRKYLNLDIVTIRKDAAWKNIIKCPHSFLFLYDIKENT